MVSLTPLSSSETDKAEADAHWFETEVYPLDSTLRGWLRARFPSLNDTDDLVQESYLRLFRARVTTPIASSKAFLFATARNLALNKLRRQNFENTQGFGQNDASSVLDEKTDVPEAVARCQELDMLARAIQSLPPRCREVFVLRRLHGLSQKEVAARMGISESTVDAQCIIALKKCAQFFRNERMPND